MERKDTKFVLVALFFVGWAILAILALPELRDALPEPLVLLLIGLLILVLFFALSFLVMYLFNISPTRPLFGTQTFPSWEEQIAEMEQRGLLATVDFRATRALMVGSGEDEYLHYLLELDNGNILHLTGEYLFEYEQVDDAEDGAEDFLAGRFPCTIFTVRQHRDEGYVLDIICRGAPLLRKT